MNAHAFWPHGGRSAFRRRGRCLLLCYLRGGRLDPFLDSHQPIGERVFDDAVKDEDAAALEVIDQPYPGDLWDGRLGRTDQILNGEVADDCPGHKVTARLG